MIGKMGTRCLSSERPGERAFIEQAIYTADSYRIQGEVSKQKTRERDYENAKSALSAMRHARRDKCDVGRRKADPNKWYLYSEQRARENEGVCLPRVVRARRDVGRRVSRQNRLVALAQDAWAHRSLGGEEGGRVLGL